MTTMDQIELVDAVRQLRSELERAMVEGTDQAIQFETIDLQMEFQVGITRTAEGTAGLKLYVLELGAKGAYASECIQKVQLSLRPTLSDGRPVKIAEATDVSPLAAETADESG
jgi:hypothetical protein